MFRELRSKLAYWIFPEISLEKEAFQTIKKRYEENIKAFDEYRAGLTVVDLVREQLSGFNPKELDVDADELLSEIPEDEQESFLEKAKTLQTSNVLARICTFLVRKQVLFSAREAPDLQTINFGRATVNGVELVKDEIDVLAAVYDKKHEKPEPITPGEAV